MVVPQSQFGVVLLALVILVAPFHGAAGERSNEFAVSDQQMRALGVELVAIEAKATTGGVTVPAVVVLPPNAQRAVSAPLAGLIRQVLVEENQSVVLGTPLLVLASPELGQLQLRLIQASNHARLAQQTLARERALLGSGIIPARRVQEAEAAASDAQAEQAHAEAALQLAGISDAAIRATAAGVRPHQDLTVVADMAGTVVGIDIKAGQRVTAADQMMRIAQFEQLRVDIQAPGQQAAQWPPGTHLVLSGGIDARVLSTSNVVAGAQLVTLRAEVLESSPKLRPGELIQAELPVATDAWELPLSALARESGQAYVFVRVGDQFRATPVTLLANDGQRAKVRGNLEPGQYIAVTSVISLKAAWQGVGGMEEE